MVAPRATGRFRRGCHPGRAAARSDAAQTRDLNKLCIHGRSRISDASARCREPLHRIRDDKELAYQFQPRIFVDHFDAVLLGFFEF